jgi:hypothetical protein
MRARGACAAMTQIVSTCPNCGAKVVFRWSSSIQTVCEYCKSVLVRTDVDLQKVGQISDAMPGSSPIQLNTEGIYGGKAFVVIGRILYEYSQGAWNEWHVVMNDGTNAWLSDAQGEYAVSTLRTGEQLPPRTQLQVGQQRAWKNKNYTLTVITEARYAGIEGELAFQTWNKKQATFADFRTEDSHFATLDYSDTEPALYLGEFMEFDDLHLKNLRSFEGWP